jgi:uncharacterized repeat protein (TIGR03803 family)
MKKSSLWKMVCAVCLFCALMAVNSSAQTLTTLVSFDGTNGAAPAASLIQASDGNLYGTTEYGGPISGCEGGFNPCGTVFKITHSGTLTTLHTFVYSDGAFPVSPVVQGSDGNFYGTNQGEGDSGGSGAIFKMTPSGTLTVLDSVASVAGLVQGRDGNFYGTTPRSYTNGTVFKVTPSGTLTTLHTFDGTDGNNPQAGLVLATDGNFYGTTFSGGTSSYCGGGCGTVFKMTPGGSLTTLHSFSGTDGYNVQAGLVQGRDGNFYGTTVNGGGAHNVGEVFKITPSGTLTVLYSFCSQTGCTDGAYPRAALMQATDGNFYGTTSAGAANGQGTIFAITPGGSLTTLYSFCAQTGCADGASPQGGLVQDSHGNFYGTTIAGGADNLGTVFKLTPLPSTTTVVTSTPNPSEVGQLVTLTATVSPSGPPAPTGTVSFTSNAVAISGCTAVPLTSLTAVCTTSTLAVGTDAIVATYSGDSNYSGSSGTLSQLVNPIPSPVQFVAVTPCRVVDTRPQHGGSGPIPGGTFQSFPIQQAGGCNIPATAAAYSLNVTVVPSGPLGYLTIWPTGEGRPVVSTLNSADGRVKANAAIVPAGSSGEVSVYVTDTTNVALDIDGYFAPVSGSTLAFYPLTPCRVADTRYSTYPPGLGPPSLTGGQERQFPILNATTTCNIPPSGVAAYSLNVTVVPHGTLGYLSVWPTGEAQPTVSTLNDVLGRVIANAAIVPAGTDGKVSVYPTDNTDLIIDINGYFAPAGAGGLSLYAVAPCRVIDTRHVGSGQPFIGILSPPVDVTDSFCGPPATAHAYVFYATVIPPVSLGYLTLWPDGGNQPLVSTLNAADGSITNNMAIVPTHNGKVDAYASGLTQLILDISSYFAP